MSRDRRRFIADAARFACGAGIVGLGLGLAARGARARPPQALRPPGARAEGDFQAACVRCGLCVRDCPYDILMLATPGNGIATGTPYFVARSGPCEMCEHIPCTRACPTGALDPALRDIREARMGTAVLVDGENCLNHLGLRCDICYRVCPAIDQAITLEQQSNARTGRHALFIPTVQAGHCTGCGKCEQACPLPEAAIKVLPAALARGAAGEHYRLGWVEKDRAGRPLAGPEPEHQYNLPPGQQYEPGRGLRSGPADGAGTTPSEPAAPTMPAAPAAPAVPARAAPPAASAVPKAMPPRALHGDRL